jgi:hypothetical protein
MRPENLCPNYEILLELDSINELEPIVTHLLNLFGLWQAPHLQILHRALFFRRQKAI